MAVSGWRLAVVLPLLTCLSMGQRPHGPAFDGWVSTAKPGDVKTSEAIVASLRKLGVPRGMMIRDHARWLIPIELKNKPRILQDLKVRGFGRRVVFSDDPLRSK
jgi:hypothetical protein